MTTFECTLDVRLLLKPFVARPPGCGGRQIPSALFPGWYP
jgi:hypothetical protein